MNATFPSRIPAPPMPAPAFVPVPSKEYKPTNSGYPTPSAPSQR